MALELCARLCWTNEVLKKVAALTSCFGCLRDRVEICLVLATGAIDDLIACEVLLACRSGLASRGTPRVAVDIIGTSMARPELFVPNVRPRSQKEARSSRFNGAVEDVTRNMNASETG